ncbi:MAG: alginate lyase family protein [Abitibacteriaceae bacterium]|nr:alginate lyase family protein [Abditibacteriaceae bacterium]
MRKAALPSGTSNWPGIQAVQAAEAQPASRLTNAATPDYGAKVSLTVGAGARKDPQTEPESVIDNNIHTRQVVSGAPYTLTITLLFRVPVERLAFADSDYATELAPKDLEITLDDGTVLHHTLEVKRPEKRKPIWQEVAVGKEAQTIKVTVLSNYTLSDKVNWGGLAEIAILTPTDLDAKFKIPGYDPKTKLNTFVHVPSLTDTGTTSPQNGGLTTPNDTPVQLPPHAAPGEHPRLLLTHQEVTELKTSLQQTERGKAALDPLVKVADGALTAPVQFPDPKGPLAQVQDRGDAVTKQHDRLSLNAGTLGLAYTLTGDLKYAHRAGEIVLGYAQRYADYPEHQGVNRNDTGKVMGQRLSEAMWLIPLIESYDYIYDSGVLTAADKQQIETQLLRPAITFIWRKEPATEVAERDRRNPNWRTAQPAPSDGKPVGNWLNYYNSATMMTGAILNDQNMLDMAAANFRELLSKGIGADGMWNEGAIGYQMFALTAMVPGFETAARQGIDLWGFDHNRVKMLFDSPLRYAYPDGTAPGIHDSARTRFGDWSTMVYDYAYLRYRDPRYAFLTNASPRQLLMSEAVYFPTRIYTTLPEPQATTYPSTVFGNLGYAILRQPNIYALMDYGPHGGVHGHYDKLNLVLFGTGAGGKGDELGGEPVFHRYEDPLHDEWTKQTVAHNTMTVDEQSQLACTGELQLFESTPQVKLMRAQALAYPGALLDRTVIVTSDAILDLYHGRSAFARTWDRTFRYQGKLAQFPTAPVGNAAPLGQRDGYQHLQVVQRQPAAQSWQATWQTTVGALNLSLAGAAGQQVILAQGPDKEQMALARQEGTAANFAAVLGLEAWHNGVQAAHFIAPDNAQDATQPVVFEMTQQDGTRTQVIISHKPGPWQALGWNSDAAVLYIRQHGAELRVLLAGGTFAQSDELTTQRRLRLELRQPSAGNYLAELRGGKLEIVSAWASNP